ncbi:MAG: hypothetical protein H7Z16_17425 [Pyrinomonadaceae bacterium]|nr:hypothetical protein [Pyrinomonadaceae bacterium]
MSATLTDSTHLLVPLHLDALLVGADPQHFSWANLAPNYSALKRGVFLGTDLRDILGDSEALPTGLHLHFRLPAALRHGAATAGGPELEFPTIPNRWLVVRYYQQTAGTKTLAWIIRSDAVGTEDAVPWPVLPQRKEDGPLQVRRTGSCEVLPQSPFQEDDTAAALRITAVGNGDVGFSAHYPACHSILGFHDDLNDVPEKTKLSYLVAGWYSAAADDPLQAFIDGLDSTLDAQEKLAALNKWLTDRRWSADGLEAGGLPSRMICHGLVRGIDWQGAGRDYSDVEVFEDFDNAGVYSVDVGNSSAEALASMLAVKAGKKTSADPELLEDVLTAFQTGLLSHDPTISELDAELHRQGFAPFLTGRTFVIQSDAGAPDPDAVAQPHTPLPQHLGELLQDLNAAQQVCDRHAQLLKDYHWEVYALWHRWMMNCKDGRTKDAALLKTNLDGLTSFVQNFDQLPQVVAAMNRRQGAEDVLTEALGKETIPKQRDGAAVPVPKYRLTTSAGDRFFVPNDPVVLVSGPALERKGTFTPAQSDTLPCRVTGQEVLEYTYDIPNGQSGNKVTADDRIASLGIAGPDMAALPAFMQRLFSETVLLQDIEPSILPTDIGWRTPTSPSEKGLPRISGRMPAAISVWDWEHNPWIPIYLTWEFEWLSDYQAVTGAVAFSDVDGPVWRLQGDDEDARSDEWKYRRQVDLVRDRQLPAQPASQPQTYHGYALLARPTFLALAEKLRKEPDKVPPRVKEIADPLQALLENRPMLSQALVGFQDGLIMRRVGDQLPPLDYNRYVSRGPNNKKLLQFFVDAIYDVLRPEDRFDCSPAPSYPFLPIQAGRMNLTSLMIIDAFGQKIQLIPNLKPALRASQRLAADGHQASLNSGPIQLRPRSVRPMRLTFDPAPAGNPTTIAPALSPICGWVVPNQFDQNLTLYGANGKPLGALQKKFELKPGSGQRFFYWVDVPGTVDGSVQAASLTSSEADTSAKLEEHLEKTIENLHLRDFARYVLDLTGDQGDAFARVLDQALTATESRVPDEDPGVSVLIGRPLALVRAEIRLEIPGLPALDQNLSWRASGPDSAIRQLLETNGITQFPQDQLRDLLKTGGVENVRWPVRLGDRRGGNDGLVGFFVGDPVAAPRPFFASWGFGGTPIENVLNYAQNLAVDCLHPLQVTLLMDPQARVHATSGVLPRVFLELQPSDSAGAKSAREVFFQTAPVLGTPATPQIPKPSDDYGEWSWAYRPAVTQWAEHGDLVSATDRGGFSGGWPTISEGWLKLKIDPVQVLGLWLRDEASQPDSMTLAWSVRGAKLLQLFDKEQKLVREWSDSPLPREWKISKPPRDATYELVASDEAGNEDRKKIKIQESTTT